MRGITTWDRGLLNRTKGDYIYTSHKLKNQLWAAAYYYYYEAYLLKVGLILYCGIVCSYITWNSINKKEREMFSHTEEDHNKLVVTQEPSACNMNRCSKYSSHGHKLLIWRWQVETFAYRMNSGVLCPEPGERLISTLWIWPSFRTKCFPHHNWPTRYGPLRNQWEDRGWKRGEGLVMDDPFFWIKGFTKWMTSAWEWDTTRVPICSRLATG